MTKAVPAVFVLVLVCLFTLSAALPSILNQVVSAPAQGEPNAPRTLLGKPYRRRRGSQGCPPSCWTLVTDSNHSGGNADPNAHRVSAHQAQIANGGWTQTKMNTELRVQFPLPFVLDALNSPEFVPARLRLVRSKRPFRYSPCSDDAPLSSRAPSGRVTTRDEDAQRVQPPVVSGSEEEMGSREVSVPVRRSRRLYDKGEWKSRLFEEY